MRTFLFQHGTLKSVLAAGLLTVGGLATLLPAVEVETERSRDGNTVTVVKNFSNEQGGTATITHEVTRSKDDDGVVHIDVDSNGSRTNAEGESRNWEAQREIERMRNEDGTLTSTASGSRQNDAGKEASFERTSTVSRDEDGVRHFEREGTRTNAKGQTVTVETTGTAQRNEDGSWEREGERTVTGEKGSKTTELKDRTERNGDSRAARSEARRERQENHQEKRQNKRAKGDRGARKK